MRRVAHGLLVLVTMACATHKRAPDYAAPLRQAITLAGDGHESSQRDALAAFLSLADSARHNRQSLTEGTARAFAAQVYINLGRPDSARPLARKAVELLGQRGGRAPPGVHTLLGETLQYLGSPDSALTLYRQALPSPDSASTRRARGSSMTSAAPTISSDTSTRPVTISGSRSSSAAGCRTALAWRGHSTTWAGCSRPLVVPIRRPPSSPPRCPSDGVRRTSRDSAPPSTIWATRSICGATR